MSKISNIHQGFTLIELLVVISIIGILATLVTANLSAARQRGRDAERKADLKSISTALRLYYNDHGEYPANGFFDSLWGSSWSDGTTVYMNTVPNDPLPDVSYSYQKIDDDNYVLSACLENESDDKGVADDSCASGFAYQVRP